MHSIEKTPYGLQIKLSGLVPPDEMGRWFNDEKFFLASLPQHPFGVVIDLRELEQLPAASLAELQKGQQLMRDNGLQRSAVVVDNAATRTQHQEIARKTGVDEWTRYIDASKKDVHWHDVAQAWVAEGKEPEA